MGLAILLVATIILSLCCYCLIKRRLLIAAKPSQYLRALAPVGWKQILCWITIPLTLGSVACMYYFFYKVSVLLILKRMLLLALTWPMAVTDLKEMRIPNKMILVGIGVRLAYLLPELLLTENPLNIWKQEGIAAVIAGVLALVCSLMSGGSLGAGDVKLVFVMGLFLGIQPIFYCMFFSIFITFFYAIAVLVMKKKNKKDSIPFAPFILMGVFVAYILTGS